MNDETRIRENLQQAAEEFEVAPFPGNGIERTARQHKRRGQIGLAAAAVVAVASAVVVNGVARDGSSGDTVSASDTENARQDPTGDGAPGPVSATMGVDAAMKYTYSTVSELALAPQVTTVVRGTITNVTYQTVEGMAKTTFTVDVSQSLLGSAKQTITVHEDGGYIKASEIMAEIKDKFPDAKQSLDPDSYVDVPFEGASHPEKGEEVLLFLMEDPNVGNEGDFMGVMSVYSRFTLDQDGSFRRAASVPGMEETVTASAVQSILSKR